MPSKTNQKFAKRSFTLPHPLDAALNQIIAKSPEKNRSVELRRMIRADLAKSKVAKVV